MIRSKQEVVSSRVNLLQLYEASVGARQNDRQSIKTEDQTVQRNCTLVQRTAIDGTLRKRAVADAARALTALWKCRLAR